MVRPVFMHRWDQLYLKKVKDAGMEMLLYERYVDDSNQILVAPPEGTIYDPRCNSLRIDQEHIKDDHEKEKDERTIIILRRIANSIMHCIQMEADWPSKNIDKKIPILDMKVWLDTHGNTIYQHYEKPVKSKGVLHAKSAHSSPCKRSVHTQEIIRRLLNCSFRLSWEDDVVPIITDYMRRMKTAGYGERYRHDVLKHAISIYDSKWKDHNEDIRPIYRTKEYQKEKIKDNKTKKKHNWAKKGGMIAPIFIPSTPGSKLLKSIRQIATEEGKEGIKFNIIELGSRTLKRQFQNSNPTKTPGCNKENCMCCEIEKGKGGPCHKANVNYQVECNLCPDGMKSKYIGETSRNVYTRISEHYNRRNDDNSFMKKHMEEHHDGQEYNFTTKVTHINKDCLTRQIREGVLIRKCVPCMNTKSEWHQPSLYRIQNEIIRE